MNQPVGQSCFAFRIHQHIYNIRLIQSSLTPASSGMSAAWHDGDRLKSNWIVLAGRHRLWSMTSCPQVSRTSRSEASVTEVCDCCGVACAQSLDWRRFRLTSGSRAKNNWSPPGGPLWRPLRDSGGCWRFRWRAAGYTGLKLAMQVWRWEHFAW